MENTINSNDFNIVQQKVDIKSVLVNYINEQIASIKKDLGENKDISRYLRDNCIYRDGKFFMPSEAVCIARLLVKVGFDLETPPFVKFQSDRESILNHMQNYGNYDFSLANKEIMSDGDFLLKALSYRLVCFKEDNYYKVDKDLFKDETFLLGLLEKRFDFAKALYFSGHDEEFYKNTKVLLKLVELGVDIKDKINDDLKSRLNFDDIKTSLENHININKNYIDVMEKTCDRDFDVEPVKKTVFKI